MYSYIIRLFGCHPFNDYIRAKFFIMCNLSCNLKQNATSTHVCLIADKNYTASRRTSSHLASDLVALLSLPFTLLCSPCDVVMMSTGAQLSPSRRQQRRLAIVCGSPQSQLTYSVFINRPADLWYMVIKLVAGLCRRDEGRSLLVEIWLR